MDQSGGTGGHPVTSGQASRNAQPDGPAEVPDEGGHGSTPAAWTAVGLVLLGSLIVSLAVVFTSWTWAIIGTVVIVAGPIAGAVLSRMGHGAHRPDGGPVGASRPGHH